MALGARKPTTIPELRKALIEDSIDRKKLVDKLVKAVREDEREKTLLDLRSVRAKAEHDRG